MKGQGDDFGVLPSNLGFEDNSVAELIGSHNELVLQRMKLITNSTEKNPVIRELDRQIVSLRNSLKSSLDNLERSARTELKTLRAKEQLYTSQLAKIPGYEKDYRDILREQQIKETLYLYLLEKREALASEISRVRELMSNHAVSDPSKDSLESYLNASTCLSDAAKSEIRVFVEHDNNREEEDR